MKIKGPAPNLSNVNNFSQKQKLEIFKDKSGESKNKVYLKLINKNLLLKKYEEKVFFKNLFKNPQNLNKFLENLNKHLDPLQKELKVEIDKDLNMPIFKIIDKNTKEVLRQIPWEEVIKFLKNLQKILKSEHIQKESLKGLLFKKEV